MRSVQFDPGARSDLEDAANYYGAQGSDLKSRFVNAIEAATNLIVEAPKRWLKVRGEIRKYVVTGFPYSILYIDRGFEVFIVAVSHHKRMPDYWIDRLD